MLVHTKPALSQVVLKFTTGHFRIQEVHIFVQYIGVIGLTALVYGKPRALYSGDGQCSATFFSHIDFELFARVFFKAFVGGPILYVRFRELYEVIFDLVVRHAVARVRRCCRYHVKILF